MPNTTLLADLGRALDLLAQVDESELGFPPDPTVSEDVQALSGVKSYPTGSHRENLEARIAAVVEAGDELEPRAPSRYVEMLIVAMRQAPRSDD